MSFDLGKLYNDFFKFDNKDTDAEILDPVSENEVNEYIKHLIQNETGRERIEKFIKN